MARGRIFEDLSKRGHAHTSSNSSKSGFDRSQSGSKTNLLVLTLSGLVSVYAHAGSITVVALGLSYAVLEVLAFHLIERAQDISRHHNQNGGSVIYSASGMLTQSSAPSVPTEERWLSVLRDVSMAGAFTTTVAGITLEGLHFGGLINYGLIGHLLGDHWQSGQGVVAVVYALSTVLIHIVVFAATVFMVSCGKTSLLC